MNEPLIETILSCPSLPSLPASAMKIIELCRREDVAVGELSTTISHDPALTVKILKTVNSSYYGLSHRVTTIRHAVVLLGINTVRTLAMGFTLVEALRDEEGKAFDPTPIWQFSLYSAMVARSVSLQTGNEFFEEAFIGALLQDLGVLAMIQTLGPKYVSILKKVMEHPYMLQQVERKLLDLDHCVIGESLATRWHLPEIIVAPIRCHENVDLADEEDRPLVNAVALGNKAAAIFLWGRTEETVKDYLAHATEWFNLENSVAMELLEMTAESVSQMSRMFEIREMKNVTQIMADANEVMVQMSLVCHLKVQEVEQQNEELREKAHEDSLTGVPNRGCFDDYFEEQYHLVSKGNMPLSLIMIDVDRFKKVNDDHGHVVGDKILTTIAQTITACIRREDMLAARYGGEEFAIVTPKVDEEGAIKIAERLRQRIEAAAVPLNATDDLSVTVSLGIATHNREHLFATPELMIDAADKALYSAKDAGRNQVRVYGPQGCWRASFDDESSEGRQAA
jgi:diguanylate cyclase (GGDEF)-like protein